MLEYQVIQNPSEGHLEELARGFLKGEDQYFDALLSLVKDNMTVRGDQKLLVCRGGSEKQPIGFVNYESKRPDGFEDIEQASKLFSYGRITYGDEQKSPSDLKHFEPFASYSHKGALAFIKHIEVAKRAGGSGVGSKILEKLVGREKVELIEGMAHPSSLGFWLKMGFSFPGLRSDELTVIAWLNPIYRSRTNWGFYCNSDFKENSAQVFFFWSESHQYAFYNFHFSGSTVTYDANMGQVAVDGAGDLIRKRSISLPLDQLKEKVGSLEKGVTTEISFREFVEAYHVAS